MDGVTNQLPGAVGTVRSAASADAPSRVLEMRFTSTPRGARLARRLSAHRLDAWGVPYGTGPHDEIVVVVGELTANAVRHGHVGGRDFHLRMEVTGCPGTVRIEVTDTRGDRTPPGPAEPQAPGPEDVGGRGLLLVAGLAARWGWCPRCDGPGKTVWAEYLLPASG